MQVNSLGEQEQILIYLSTVHILVSVVFPIEIR
jgi:hypothetical protein